MKKVAIIMGSDSDFPIVSKAIKQLKDYEVPFEVHVMSAHRTPDEASEFAKNAIKNGFGVIIATVMMPTGIPVATVAVNGAANAAILAIQMLALSDETLAQKLVDNRKKMAETVVSKDKDIQSKVDEI